MAVNPLLQEVMRDGRRVAPSPSLDAIRRHAADQLRQLPAALRSFDRPAEYPVEIGQPLVDLAARANLTQNILRLTAGKLPRHGRRATCR